MTQDFSIFPAIDLRHGQVVRLKEGDPSRQTAYSTDPAQVAEKWINAGAKWLHVINLDGAFNEKENENYQALIKILDISTRNGVKVQFGGGIRSLDILFRIMDYGITRAILGTAALENEEVIKQAVENYGNEQIAVSLDARDGYVQVRGWQTHTKKTALQVATDMIEIGIRWIVFTDISRDGLQTGINLESTRTLATINGLKVIASGGVKDWEDILKAYNAHLPGIIVGRALYENQFDPRELFNFPENIAQIRK